MAEDQRSPVCNSDNTFTLTATTLCQGLCPEQPRVTEVTGPGREADEESDSDAALYPAERLLWRGSPRAATPQPLPSQLFHSRGHLFLSPGDSGPRSRKARGTHRGPGNSAQQSTAISRNFCGNAHWAGPMWRVFLLRDIRSIYSTHIVGC